MNTRRLRRFVVGAILLVGCSQTARSVGTTQPPPRVSRLVAMRDIESRVRILASYVRERFDRADATRLVGLADRGFRARGNEAYVATLRAVMERLRAAGFEERDPPETDSPPPNVSPAPGTTMRLEALSSDAIIWDARAARIEISSPTRERIHSFDANDDTERTMLVAYSHPGEATARLVEIDLDDLSQLSRAAGNIVLTNASANRSAAALASAGARAVLSAATEGYNHVERHPDTIRYEMFDGDAPPGVPVFNISPRAAARLRERMRTSSVTLHVRSECTLRRGPAQTLVARIEGSDPGANPAVFVAHVDEPGANDNASGVATLTHAAMLLARAIDERRTPPPSRPVLFLFGMEIEMSRQWLEFHPRPLPAFAVSIDMAGEAPEISPMLIERTPDPGTLRVRAPDSHSDWVSGSTRHDLVRGYFLNAVAQTALALVDENWPVRNHPFEGGSDHVPFLSRGVPSLLLWHFPDDAYHTNRDRSARVSDVEMARVAAGIVAIASLGAGGATDRVLDVAAVVRARSLERWAIELNSSRDEAQHASDATRDAVIARERAHLVAWANWFEQAVTSCDLLATVRVDETRAQLAAVAADLRAVMHRDLDAFGSVGAR